MREWLTDYLAERNRLALKLLHARIGDALDALTERERLIIEKRLAGAVQLQTLGQELGITRERVRQVEASALRKLDAVLQSRSSAA